MNPFRPLLAPHECPLTKPDFFEFLQYPLMVSPKYDGIRCIVLDGVCYSRSMKPLPSLQVQEDFGHLEYFDGELIVGCPTDPNTYNRTQSHVMSKGKPGELRFYVFDYVHPDWLEKAYIERVAKLERLINGPEQTTEAEIKWVEQSWAASERALIEWEESYLSAGFEGVMMRHPGASYKFGRGTYNEGIIYKLKRFQDAEGRVIDVLGGMTNTNKQERDERGYAKRSFKKAGMVTSGMLGGFLVDYEGQEITVAPGAFPHPDRYMILANKEAFIGRLLRFRFMSYGSKDRPRFARAVGFRDRMDL